MQFGTNAAKYMSGKNFHGDIGCPFCYSPLLCWNVWRDYHDFLLISCSIPLSQADICQLGMDQRKVNVLAREYCDDIKRKNKPIILSHRML